MTIGIRIRVHEGVSRRRHQRPLHPCRVNQGVSRRVSTSGVAAEPLRLFHPTSLVLR
jgi:hypothetical protein